MIISRCLLAVFANMSKALAIETSYDLYRTLLENDWSGNRVPMKMPILIALSLSLRFLASKTTVSCLVPSFLMNLDAFMPSKSFARSFSISESLSSVGTPSMNRLMFGFSDSTAFSMSVSEPRKLLFQEVKTSSARSFVKNSRLCNLKH